MYERYIHLARNKFPVACLWTSVPSREISKPPIGFFPLFLSLSLGIRLNWKGGGFKVFCGTMGRRRTSPVNQLFTWVRKQSVKVKTALAVSTVLFLLVALKFLVRDHNYFFIASEFSHFIGIVVLIYKLSTQNSCAGNFLFFIFVYCFLHWSTLFSFQFWWFRNWNSVWNG